LGAAAGDRRQFFPIDPQQFDVPRKVIGPMSCQAAPPLGPQRLPELGENPLPSAAAFVLELMWPQRQGLGDGCASVGLGLWRSGCPDVRRLV